ncbi:hypothetical protein P3T35_000200 [Kitasatospora sp. GP30]|uniref:hypothetical protein n=1 Tax=Kitasatospora sp. GP30 TaxID=3035084 RepID=UPI000C70B899|nr:hypothetical protein [Kitasatospora sp. GP30]MDH6138223.1 hypothetical protein [Kitasatospora sp. GP30]
MPTDHDFENDLSCALRDAAELTPEPLTHLLTVGAKEHGRRWRRRRRTAVASGLATLVLVGTGGFMALGDPIGAVGPSSTTSTEVSKMSKDEVVALVTGLLPPGKATVLDAGGTGEGTLPGHEYRTGGTLLFDDGSGASIFTYTADRTDLTPERGAVCMDGFSMPQDSCNRSTLPDGSVVVIDKLRSDHTPGGREWRATWAAPDGRRVSVIEYNGQPAAKNRENPPLSAEQLTAFITAPAWERIFSALPLLKNAPTNASPASAPPPAAGPSATELLAKLVPLLPTGATSSPADGSNRPDLTVTLDGRTSMVQVSDEPASARGRDEEKSVEASPAAPLEVREKLPDGTLVVTNRFGNGKTATDPILHWTADVYSPDGRHVSISEWNGENGYTARPGAPALSPEQLKAIVINAAWR